MIGNPLLQGARRSPERHRVPRLRPTTRSPGPRRRQATPNSNVVPPGYCKNLAPVAPSTTPPVTTKSTTMPPNIPPIAVGRADEYYWICLRRPANPFAPPQADISLVDANGQLYNPMVVVDAMRFPYTEGGVTAGPPTVSHRHQAIFSSQRCQPFRGGHAVRLPNDTSNAAAPLYTPYGYSEQMAVPRSTTSNAERTIRGSGGDGVTSAKYPIHDTIGPPTTRQNHGITSRSTTATSRAWPSSCWCRVARQDLFTKQFVELAPMPPSTTAVASPPTTFPVPRSSRCRPEATTPTSPYPDTAAAPAHRAEVAQCRGCFCPGDERHCRPAAHLPVPRG